MPVVRTFTPSDPRLSSTIAVGTSSVLVRAPGVEWCATHAQLLGLPDYVQDREIAESGSLGLSLARTTGIHFSLAKVGFPHHNSTNVRAHSWFCPVETNISAIRLV